MLLSNIDQALIILINFFAILIGLSVYKDNPKDKINKTLVLMTFLMLVWVNFAYIARITGKSNPILGLSFLKTAWFITPLFSASLYFLVIHTLKKEKEYRILSSFVLSFGALTAFFAGFTNLVVESIRFVEPYMAINYGPAMLPYLGVALFLVVATMFLFFKEYFKSSPFLRLKLQYFLIGISIFYIANIVFNIILPIVYDIVHLYWIADYSTIFLLGFTGYAIVKRELFGIKVILTRAVIASFFVFLLIQLFLSESNLSRIWSIFLIVVFAYFGYLINRTISREIEDKERIRKLGEKLIEREKALSRTFSQIVEERGNRVCRTAFCSMEKDKEIFELKKIIKELENKPRNKK